MVKRRFRFVNRKTKHNVEKSSGIATSYLSSGTAKRCGSTIYILDVVRDHRFAILFNFFKKKYSRHFSPYK